MLRALGSGSPWRCGLPASGLMTVNNRPLRSTTDGSAQKRRKADDGRPKKAESAGAWKLAVVIPKASFASVKFTYTFDLGDDWTHACEFVASDDPPDFSHAPGYVRTSMPVPIFGW